MRLHLRPLGLTAKACLLNPVKPKAPVLLRPLPKPVRAPTAFRVRWACASWLPRAWSASTPRTG